MLELFGDEKIREGGNARPYYTCLASLLDAPLDRGMPVLAHTAHMAWVDLMETWDSQDLIR